MIKRLLLLIASFLLTYQMWVEPSFIIGAILFIVIIILLIAIVIPNAGCAPNLLLLPSVIIFDIECVVLFIKMNELLSIFSF